MSLRRPGGPGRTESTTGLVLVSHSALLAAGVVELAAQMAPDVVLRPAGGTDDARLGTSFDVVERAVAAELDAGCDGVVILADIGSARMTAESVVEALEDSRVVLAGGAFVEGAVAAAVAAQTGGSVRDVVAAAAAATRQVQDELDPEQPRGVTCSDASHDRAAVPTASGAVSRRVRVTNPQGLHARPAATLAQLAASFDAEVTIDGVDAGSLLSLMGLGLTQGLEVTLAATGPEAHEAIDAVAHTFESGFGEL
ncbi:dihydroxyacetone kinase phosphoryl donor subunit DhaM [Miniimonas sp. S16]|uniref:dihydroxyacetone kinase phosphoryl donor subunit DhaM n=1 Tax=Miniimonas sp. S16 TaxID=2171623 RepID=UPI000D5274FD|nr:dihydroxyacetone kinase phosphoryl donor subunit DhaM [Miniimonas sp. S16]